LHQDERKDLSKLLRYVFNPPAGHKAVSLVETNRNIIAFCDQSDNIGDAIFGRIFQGVGVERVFMLHSPQVASVKVERRGKVRRAKLFYLRDRVGKATRVKQRFDR